MKREILPVIELIMAFSSKIEPECSPSSAARLWCSSKQLHRRSLLDDLIGCGGSEASLMIIPHRRLRIRAPPHIRTMPIVSNSIGSLNPKMTHRWIDIGRATSGTINVSGRVMITIEQVRAANDISGNTHLLLTNRLNADNLSIHLYLLRSTRALRQLIKFASCFLVFDSRKQPD